MFARKMGFHFNKGKLKKPKKKSFEIIKSVIKYQWIKTTKMQI